MLWQCTNHPFKMKSKEKKRLFTLIIYAAIWIPPRIKKKYPKIIMSSARGHFLLLAIFEILPLSLNQKEIQDKKAKCLGMDSEILKIFKRRQTNGIYLDISVYILYATKHT